MAKINNTIDNIFSEIDFDIKNDKHLSKNINETSFKLSFE